MWCHVLFLYVMSRVVSGCNVMCFVLTDMQQCAFLYCWCLIFTVVGPTFSLYLPNMQKSRKNAIPSLQSNYKGNKVLYIWIKQKKNTLIILYVWRYRDLEGFFFYSSTHWTYYDIIQTLYFGLKKMLHVRIACYIFVLLCIKAKLKLMN